MLAVLATLTALPALALASISITGPDSSDYWVQNTSKTITWTYASGDPSPISIVITNANDTYLNGGFSIDEYVDLSLKSFTITNVTLKVAPGYEVEFVNPANHSDVYATSNTFDVKAPGTPPASTSGSSSSGSGSSSTSSGASSSGSGTSTSSGSSSTSTGNGAVRAESVLYTLAACGFASLCSIML